MKALQFVKDWALIFAMVAGVACYLAFASLSLPASAHAFAAKAVAVAQPVLIFCMLFLTFCRVDPSHLRFCKWHWLLLLLQCGFFVAIGSLLAFLPADGLRVVLEGAMICLICPTATAAAVITRKLGGDLARVTTYTILINLAAAVLIPAMQPYVHPNPGMSSFAASMLILGKVFPLLLLPLVLAWLLKYFVPGLHKFLAGLQEAPFYLWVVSLAIAIAVTARSIAHTHVSLGTQLWLVAVSLLSCVWQFWIGRRIGAKYGDKITAGQALGQKNTVFAIWLGYTFFTPITSIAGGFYSIWHNVINTYQLYEHRKHSK